MGRLEDIEAKRNPRFRGKPQGFGNDPSQWYTEGQGYPPPAFAGLLNQHPGTVQRPQFRVGQQADGVNAPRNIGLVDDARNWFKGLTGNKPTPPPSGDRFDTDVIPHTLRMEGGLRDAGGELANFGIDQAYNQNVDVRNLTKDDATKIYKDKYWERPKIDEIENTTVASKVFDMGVNLGPGSSIKMLQRTLREMGQDIKVDGKIGKQTKLAIKAVEDMGGVDGLLTKLSDNQIEHYHNQLIKNPEKRTADFAGLINRGRYLRPEETNAPMGGSNTMQMMEPQTQVVDGRNILYTQPEPKQEQPQPTLRPNGNAGGGYTDAEMAGLVARSQAKGLLNSR